MVDRVTNLTIEDIKKQLHDRGFEFQEETNPVDKMKRAGFLNYKGRTVEVGITEVQDGLYRNEFDKAISYLEQ